MKIFAKKQEGAPIESYIFWNYIKTTDYCPPAGSKIFIFCIYKLIKFSYVKKPGEKIRIRINRW